MNWLRMITLEIGLVSSNDLISPEFSGFIYCIIIKNQLKKERRRYDRNHV